MKIEIKKKITGELLWEGEAESFKSFVEEKKADLRRADLFGADLFEADLRGADLRGADLRKADLRKADLRKADLLGAEIKITQKEELLKTFGVIIEE